MLGSAMTFAGTVHRTNPFIAVFLLAIAAIGCGNGGDDASLDPAVAMRLDADFTKRCDALRAAGAPETLADVPAWCPVPMAGHNAAPFYVEAFAIKDPVRRLRALSRAGGAADYRFPVDWSKPDTGLMVPYKFTEGILDAGYFLSLAAHHAVLRDDPVQVMQALVAGYMLAKHTANDPFLINQTSSSACQRSITTSLVYALTHLQFAEIQLAELQEAVYLAHRPDALPRAWFVERALAEGRDPFGKEAARWRYENARSLAQLRVAWTVLAVERFMLANAAPPAALGALTPALLDAVPDDPFSGGVLRYASDGNGYVVFSVGAAGAPPEPDVALDAYDATRQTAIYVPFEKRLPEGIPAEMPVGGDEPSAHTAML